MAYALGIATVCTVALAKLMVGGRATATPEPDMTSAAVADALGIQGSAVDAPAAQDPRLLEQLAASRSERDADQAARRAVAGTVGAGGSGGAGRSGGAGGRRGRALPRPPPLRPRRRAATPPLPRRRPPRSRRSATCRSVRPQAQAAANAVVSNVPGTDGITIGGTRSSAADPHGHPSGLALDYMVGPNAALGDEIVAYHLAHWDELGVEYIIWQQRMLSSPGGSWTRMENRGSPTANHMDHPHVNYRG